MGPDAKTFPALYYAYEKSRKGVAVMAKKRREPAYWRKAISENPDFFSMGEVRRSVVTKQRIQGKKDYCHAEQMSPFTRNEMPSCVTPEYKHVQHTYKLERLMDCKQINKFGGQHGRIPTPKKCPAAPFLDSNMVISWLRSGAVVRHNTVNQVRYMLFRGEVVGRINHNVLQFVFKSLPYTERRIAGTHEIEFRLTK